MLPFLTVQNDLNLNSTKEVVDQTKDAVYWIQQQIPSLIDFAKHFALAVIIFFIASKLIKLALRITDKFFEKSSLDIGVSKFLCSIIKIVLYILLFIILLEILGLQTSSLVALVGSAGLTIGLALQGSLSNFAGGVLILLMKPFRVGDYIVAQNNEGTVSNIDIFYTRLLTFDNRLVVIPNGALSNSSIINVTNEPIRRLDLTIAVHCTENIVRVKEVLHHILKKNEMIIKEKGTDIFVSNFDSKAITIGIRVWVNQENYWKLKWYLLEKIKEEFDKHGIIIPFEQVDVNIVNEKGLKED